MKLPGVGQLRRAKVSDAPRLILPAGHPAHTQDHGAGGGLGVVVGAGSEATLPLKPASVLKVVTTAAAIEHLGADFVFETPLYLIDNELWVIGSGDPGLGDERLEQRHNQPRMAFLDRWADAIKSRGITTLKAIRLDDRVFDGAFRHPDWPPGQEEAWYQAPVGALVVNDNCLDLRVIVDGGGIRLATTPPLAPTLIQNRLAPGRGSKAQLRRAAGADEFVLSGTIGRSDGFAPISCGNPTVFFGAALREGLAQRGIRVTGDIYRRSGTNDALAGQQPIYVERTALSDVVWRSNTFSQNLFAECLIKSLAARNSGGFLIGAPGTWQRGSEVVQATLRSMRLDTRGLEMRDGSGLSHSNRATAVQIVGVLQAMARHRAAEMWYESLAIGGEEGSMRRRFGNSPLEGRLRGKTGSIAGVSALAGYVERDDSSVVVFAVLANGPASGDIPNRIALALATAKE
ncbi:MAG: D-alanyl-D-alanine carboxypeptidase/D-alanyl-D-alanine-endopeptidase [Phycisphaerales bacterium]|nr:D-alanyl-D-alanine carboxypeptidase/D-alanyl-D-alanine-endopeptidase [Phycisphaerales bacterium]